MDLDDVLEEQGGVLTRAQALGAGLSERQLRDGAGRRLTRVRAGVYAEAARVWLADASERATLEVRAARLVSDVDLVAAGATAALVHGLPLLGPPPAVPVLVERKLSRPRHHGTSTTLHPDEIVLLRGIPVTSLARTAVDVARRRGFAAGVVTADAVLARDVPREELATVLGRQQRWRGVEHAVRATTFADRRAESALESLGRVRFAEQGLPPPQLQVWLGDEDCFARADHYWARHRTVAEADGALKYATSADLFAEKRREDRLRDAGFEVVRYTWDEALRHPELVAARVRRAFARAAGRRAA